MKYSKHSTNAEDKGTQPWKVKKKGGGEKGKSYTSDVFYK
jgi:hypothetical protein